MKIGIDIGGPKCAVIFGDEKQILGRVQFPTEGPESTLGKIENIIRDYITKHNAKADAIGISCGGPLDAKKGLIQSPPNLLGWDNIPVTDYFSKAFGIPAYLCNDADAGALAEHRYGIGRGLDNLVFLTFGTGMGAGMILNGRLYSGTSGMAGEIGHTRMCENGPVGYGKRGSFEGFCSGGGIAQIGKTLALERLQTGRPLPYCKSVKELDLLTAKLLAEQARLGDETAREVFRISGEMLGRGLAVLLDVLNPQMIIIGSVFARSEDLLRPYMEETLRKEALSRNYADCTIVPSSLGEQIGDYAALAVAQGV